MIERILKKFEEIQRQYARDYCDFERGEFDLGYFYNERTNVSLLAGAVWRENPTDNLVLEEYSSDKEGEDASDYKGRRDLWFRAGGTQYRCEAKQKWVDLETVTKADIDAIIDLAKSEAETIEERYLRPRNEALGIVFATLRLKRKNQQKANEWLENFNRLIDDSCCEGLIIHSVIIDEVLTAGGDSNLHPGVVVFIWSRSAR
ncbi:hypothetical protein [Pseudomonas sp. BN515]|uniref:hypothetical protein n=1 Tax=Pseudomonas sp. BN515 TaxID=2567892 RepID=UPI002457D449|nr:hypothetical protein [Pseudomonas sp. BN515]MDH4870606.1 hypothetical protein [Pseudomonas sp. BN515]